jgi:hypothetical protein
LDPLSQQQNALSISEQLLTGRVSFHSAQPDGIGGAATTEFEEVGTLLFIRIKAHLAFATNDEDNISCDRIERDSCASGRYHNLRGRVLLLRYELELYTVGYQTSNSLKTPSGEDAVFTDLIDIGRV